MPTPTIHISYNNYYSDSDSDEPVVSYNDNIRPSELIKSTKHCNSSDTDSDGENHILASINEQREIKKVADNYSCNFSHQPHTSIIYTKNSKNILPVSCGDNRTIKGTLNVVDICSDNPKEMGNIKL